MDYNQYMNTVENEVDYEAFDYDNWEAPKYWQYNGQDDYYKNNQLIKGYNIGANYNEIYNKSPYAGYAARRAHDPYRQFHYLQDPYYYNENQSNSYSYNPARNVFGQFTDYEDGAARSYRGEPIDYGYQSPPDYETPPQQPYEAEIFHEEEEAAEEEEHVEEEHVEEEHVEEEEQAEEPAETYVEEVDNTERDYFVEMLVSYGYGESEIYDIMDQEGYEMTGYEFAQEEEEAAA